jgi:predicted nuclease of predicted toxin-antitoxin system
LKILLDMNLSPRWVEALEAAGFTAKYWREIGETEKTNLN